MRTFQSTSACMLAILATACTTPTPPVAAGCKTFEQQAGVPTLTGVIVLSPELAKVIGVQDVATSRTATGMAAVQAAIYNCTDVDVALTVRTRFTGEQGQSEPPSAWRTVFLPPRGSAVYAESAVSPATRRLAVDVNDGNRGQMQFAPGQAYPGVPAPKH